MTRRGRKQQATESADQGKIHLGWKIPKGHQILGPETVDKIHGRDQTGFGCGATYIGEICVGVGGAEGTDDAAVEGDLSCEIGEM